MREETINIYQPRDDPGVEIIKDSNAIITNLHEVKVNMLEMNGTCFQQININCVKKTLELQTKKHKQKKIKQTKKKTKPHH